MLTILCTSVGRGFSYEFYRCSADAMLPWQAGGILRKSATKPLAGLAYPPIRSVSLSLLMVFFFLGPPFFRSCRSRAITRHTAHFLHRAVPDDVTRSNSHLQKSCGGRLRDSVGVRQAQLFRDMITYTLAAFNCGFCVISNSIEMVCAR